MPSTSCVLFDTEAEARSVPIGRIALAGCASCDFVFNTAFDPTLTEYSDRYEETQGYSPTFQAYLEALARELIDRHGLNHTRVVEIGCGKGDFLALLCRLGDNDGVAIDPTYLPDRVDDAVAGRILAVKAMLEPGHARLFERFTACRMTLEHIAAVAPFLSLVRQCIGARSDAVFYVQIPNAETVFGDGRFWDVTYEHCSYFGRRALAAALVRAGFGVTEMAVDYDGQHLAATAVAAEGGGATPVGAADHLTALAERFAGRLRRLTSHWADFFREGGAAGKSTVLWGSGAKAVGLLAVVPESRQAAAVVDINPHRHDRFMPGTGLPIIAPTRLADLRPDRVLVMNPIYQAEIAAMIADLGLSPEIVTLDGDDPAGATRHSP